MISSLGSHVDVPEYILMAVFYRFIHNLHTVITDRKKYSSELGKCLQGEVGKDHSEVKLRSDRQNYDHLDFENIFQNKLC